PKHTSSAARTNGAAATRTPKPVLVHEEAIEHAPLDQEDDTDVGLGGYDENEDVDEGYNEDEDEYSDEPEESY
ncbi:MAG: hypothetical protein JOY87_04765, partial [Candidatus Eremiobacteraeota bacterium]|nr:hypothetical protein [Candidatus Eremiobacteraeota bacterium]